MTNIADIFNAERDAWVALQGVDLDLRLAERGGCPVEIAAASKARTDASQAWAVLFADCKAALNDLAAQHGVTREAIGRYTSS